MACLDLQSLGSKDIHLLFLFDICASPKAPKLPPTGTSHPSITLEAQRSFGHSLQWRGLWPSGLQLHVFELPMLPSIKSQQLLRGRSCVVCLSQSFSVASILVRKSLPPFAPARHPALAPTCYPCGAGCHVVILPEPEGFLVVLARQTQSWNLTESSELSQGDVGIGGDSLQREGQDSWFLGS